MKVAPWVRVLSVAGIVALFAANGFAATVSISAVQDTWVSTVAGEDPNDEDIEGLVLTEPATRRVFLQWDLATAGIPAGSTINSAHIELYLFARFPTGGTFAPFVLNGRTNSDALGTVTFDETTLTNALANAAPYSTNQAESTIGDFPSFSVTPATGQYHASSLASGTEIDLLQDIFDNSGDFIAQIYGTSASGSNHVYFEDHEGTLTSTTANAPRLVIDYTVPEPSAIILTGIGVAMCACAVRRKR
jgi:hypothetical protein